jgi:hypothetical protein
VEAVVVTATTTPVNERKGDLPRSRAARSLSSSLLLHHYSIIHKPNNQQQQDATAILFAPSNSSNFAWRKASSQSNQIKLNQTPIGQYSRPLEIFSSVYIVCLLFTNEFHSIHWNIAKRETNDVSTTRLKSNHPNPTTGTS